MEWSRSSIFPIAGKDKSSTFRITYIDTFLAVRIFFVRPLPRICSTVTSYFLAVTSKILSTVSETGLFSRKYSGIEDFTISSVMGRPLRKETAPIFFNAPSICRMLESSRSARTLFGTFKLFFSAFLRRIASRSSYSGGCTSAIIPCTKRVLIRSSRVNISLGGRSLVTTICFRFSYRALKV